MPDISKSKVPEVVLIFWIIKILATTLGETGGDALSMSLGLGYLTSTFIFAALFALAVIFQIKASRFNPYLYWTTIIATTTVGTTLADYCDRSLGIGYAGGSSILIVLLGMSLVLWYKTLGTISVNNIQSTRSEIFYWTTIMLSQTLGTAFGDWLADTAGMGYLGAGAVFSGFLILIAAFYFFTSVSRTLLFWGAFILTRPLGAVVGDFLDKPIAHGGLELSRYSASMVLLTSIIVLIFIFKQNPASKIH
ncbi:MAG: hypothetical protein AB7S65_06600 [Sulfuricurvum sp.]